MSFISVLLNAFLSYLYLVYDPALLQLAFQPDASFITAGVVLMVLLLMLSSRRLMFSSFSAAYRISPRITGGLIGLFGLLACYVAMNIMMEQPLPGSASGQLLAAIVAQIGPWITAAIIAVTGLQLIRLGAQQLRNTLQRKTFN